jgi:hypothetical protein
MYPAPIVTSSVEAHLVGSVAADIISSKIASVLEERSSCLVGLSGSSSLHNLYALLGQKKNVEWKHVTFFAVDESFVPGNPLRSGATLAAAMGSFDGARFVFPDVKSLGAKESCEKFESELENLLQLPDLVILSVEEGQFGAVQKEKIQKVFSSGEARCAGYSAPIHADAFDKERLAVFQAHHFSESIPYTISARCTSKTYKC